VYLKVRKKRGTVFSLFFYFTCPKIRTLKNFNVEKTLNIIIHKLF
jgi:hypothetical protein